MNLRRNLQTMLLAVSATAVVASCTSEDEAAPLEAQSEVTISATVANSEDDPNARTTNLVYGNFAISDIRMSIDNVKLILRATSNNSNKPTIVQLRSNEPKTLSLVKDGEVTVAPIGNAMAYNGVYGKLDFELVKAQDVSEDDEMYGYSVIAKATWFDTPAIVYLDIEDKVELMFNKGLEVDGAQDLLLTMYFDKILENIPPSLVSDGNGDGLVELGPNNVDGNGEAYEAIIANIENALVLRNGEFKSK